jgi:hypothetical protein
MFAIILYILMLFFFILGLLFLTIDLMTWADWTEIARNISFILALACMVMILITYFVCIFL